MGFRYEITSGLLSEDECDLLVGYFSTRLKPSEVLGDAHWRNSEDVFVDHRSVDDPAVRSLLVRIRKDFSRLSGLPLENQELLTIMRYRPGQRFDSHYDAFTDDSHMEVEDLLGGQRVCTFLLCLRKAASGGATRFDRIGEEVVLSAGDCLHWPNVDSDGMVYEDSLHSGQSPEMGEKWVMSCWIRSARHVPVGHHFVESMLGTIGADAVRHALASIPLD